MYYHHDSPTWEQVSPLGEIWYYLQTSRFLQLAVQMLPASSALRPQMLLYILQCTRQVITERTYLPCQWLKILTVLRLRNPHVGQEMREEILGNSIDGPSSCFVVCSGFIYCEYCEGGPIELLILFYCVVMVLPLLGGWVGDRTKALGREKWYVLPIKSLWPR